MTYWPRTLRSNTNTLRRSDAKDQTSVVKTSTRKRHTFRISFSIMSKLGMLTLFAAVSPIRTFAFLGRTSEPMRHFLQRSASSSNEMTMAEKVLMNPKWPAEWPYSEWVEVCLLASPGGIVSSNIWSSSAASVDFARMDESDDKIFYDSPRLVYHIGT